MKVMELVIIVDIRIGIMEKMLVVSTSSMSHIPMTINIKNKRLNFVLNTVQL
jgi:hypothetical protein